MVMSPIPGSSLRRLNSGSAGCEFVAVVPIARTLRQRQPDRTSCLEEHPDDESADTGRDRAILENAPQGDRKPPTVLLYRVQHDEPRDHSVAKPTCGLHGDFSIRRDRNALFANPEQSPAAAISPADGFPYFAAQRLTGRTDPLDPQRSAIKRHRHKLGP